MDTYATWKAKYLADETALDYQAWLEQEVARLLAIEARAVALRQARVEWYIRRHRSADTLMLASIRRDDTLISVITQILSDAPAPEGVKDGH